MKNQQEEEKCRGGVTPALVEPHPSGCPFASQWTDKQRRDWVIRSETAHLTRWQRIKASFSRNIGRFFN